MMIPRLPLPWSRALMGLALFACGTAPLSAQAPGPDRPPEEKKPGKPPRDPKAPKEKDNPGRERVLREALSRLQPEQRKQVLKALDHVWKDEGVKQAREQLKQASEAYKKELRAALAETAPEVQPILGPLLEQLARTGLPDLQPQRKNERPRYLLLLGLDGAQADEQERLWLGGVREAVMNDPRMQEIRGQIENAEPGQRGPLLLEQVRRARGIAIEKEPRLQALFDRLPPRPIAPGPQGPPPAPPPPAEGPPPPPPVIN